MNEKPIFLIAGGAPGDTRQMAEDFRTALEACGKPNPKVAYVGTASLDNKVFFHFLKNPIIKAGAGKVTLVPIVNKQLDESAVRKTLSDADAVFITGGEVEDGIVWLKKARLDGFLTDLYRSGKLFFGTSAGAIMMGRHWVHWDKEGDDDTASLFDCLNFVPMIFDAHGEKEDWKELKCALRLLGSGAVGHGLSKGGFFSVDSEGHMTVYRNAPAVFRNAGGIIQPEGVI